MKRPWVIWLLYTLCLLGGVVATGWISVVAVGLDRRDLQAQHRAGREEDVRLALWRMDAAMGALVAREDARPYYDYAAFYPAARTYTNLLTPLAYGDVLAPSPLLTFESSYVKLHFQIDAAGEITSPQAPGGNELDLAEAMYVKSERIEAAMAMVDELRGLELAAAVAQMWRDDADDAAGTDDDGYGDTQVEGVEQQESVKQSQSRPSKLSRKDAAQQVQMSQAELQKRQASGERNRKLVKGDRRALLTRAGDVQRANVGQQRAAAKADEGEVDVVEGQMRARWVSGRLMLTRRVQVNADVFVQGVWLNWPAIEPWLIAEVADLLPGAQLQSVGESEGRRAADMSTRMLAAAPIELTPGFERMPAPAVSPPVRQALWIVWISVIAAGMAGVLVLRAVLALSERRGAFVSAVTHELRTPLTTFRMYTQMLAGRMIGDEQKRQSYLQTLHAEAERLGHLVENVLTYARLERTGRAGHIEPVAIDRLFERAETRLRQRCEQADMQFVVELAADVGALVSRTDVSAVEQILFNLVDNACKYAAANGREQTIDDRRVHVQVARRGRRILIRVRDHGPGIDANVKRRLFRPFARSAEDAAGSAPGVGLGLALSRRLARQVGGKLSLEASGRDGCCFVLALPVQG